MALVERVIPKATAAQRLAALQAAMASMNSVGLTGVGDAGVGADGIALDKRLADRGQLSVRVYAMIADAGDDFRILSREGPLLGYGGDRLTVRSVKLLAEAPWAVAGPATVAPYSDNPISAACCS